MSKTITQLSSSQKGQNEFNVESAANNWLPVVFFCCCFIYVVVVVAATAAAAATPAGVAKD